MSIEHKLLLLWFYTIISILELSCFFLVIFTLFLSVLVKHLILLSFLVCHVLIYFKGFLFVCLSCFTLPPFFFSRHFCFSPSWFVSLVSPIFSHPVCFPLFLLVCRVHPHGFPVFPVIYLQSFGVSFGYACVLFGFVCLLDWFSGFDPCLPFDLWVCLFQLNYWN